MTGLNTDVSIAGAGYFMVKNPQTGEIFYTRFGELVVDEAGYIITIYGQRLQGFPDGATNEIDDLRIEAHEKYGSAAVVSYYYATNGAVHVNFADGESAVEGQFALQLFQNPTALISAGPNILRSNSAAGAAPNPAAPGTGSAGFIQTNSLELLVPELSLSHYSGPPTNFTQGILTPTGIPLDLAIEGNGLFLLRRTNDNTLFATRAGVFYLDGNGVFTHYSGMKLQGYNDDELATIGDVRVTGTNIYSTNQLVVNYSIDEQGRIVPMVEDGTTFVCGEILLVTCADPNLVARTNFDLYPVEVNPELWSDLQEAGLGWNEIGNLEAGYVELSQFDTNLLTTRSNINFFIQGEVEETGVTCDLALSGNGFFTVRDPVKNIFYATRVGAFSLDANNYMVTAQGYRLQGMNNTNLSTYGDIQINNADFTYSISSYSISYDGLINVKLNDGTQFVRAQALLQLYHDLQALKPIHMNLYSNVTAALPYFTNGLQGYQQIAGIQSGALEIPNVVNPLSLPPVPSYHLLVKDLEGSADVQASSDLIHWNVIGQVDSSDLNSAEFVDVPHSSPTFYRLAAPYW